MHHLIRCVAWMQCFGWKPRPNAWNCLQNPVWQKERLRKKEAGVSSSWDRNRSTLFVFLQTPERGSFQITSSSDEPLQYERGEETSDISQQCLVFIKQSLEWKPSEPLKHVNHYLCHPLLPWCFTTFSFCQNETRWSTFTLLTRGAYAISSVSKEKCANHIHALKCEKTTDVCCDEERIIFTLQWVCEYISMCKRVKVKGFIEEYSVMRMSENDIVSLCVMDSVICPVISGSDVLKTSWNIITVSDFIDIFFISCNNLYIY